jgi:hypothetical protein
LQTVAGDLDVAIPLSDLDERTRDDVRRSSTDENAAVQVSAPLAVTGRFAAKRETQHRYQWHAEKGEFWSISATSLAIGGSVDLAIAVLVADGKAIADNDDAGITTDAAWNFQAAATGDYTCVVRAMSTLTGGGDEVYRLEIARSAADFALTAPQRINVASGGKVEAAITASRAGGFDGPISLSIDGLPPGVTVEGDPNILSGKSETKLTFVAAGDAAVVAAPFFIRGAAKVGETSVTRTAMCEAAGNLAPRLATDARADRAMLAMTMTPPIELKLVDGERQRDVPRGTTCRAEFDVVRKSGFAGDLRIEMASQQDLQRLGVRGAIVDVPRGADRVVYPCFMPEWLSTDLTRRVVAHGVAVVPDAKGNLRHLVQPATGRITMIMEGALMKLTADADDLTARPGGQVDVPVSVTRSAKFPVDAIVELLLPDELAGAIRAESIKLRANEQRGTLRIETQPDSRLSGDWPLTIKATSLEEGKWPVVSQTEVTVRFANSP